MPLDFLAVALARSQKDAAEQLVAWHKVDADLNSLNLVLRKVPDPGFFLPSVIRVTFIHVLVSRGLSSMLKTFL